MVSMYGAVDKVSKTGDTMTGQLTLPDLSVGGLTGATAGCRFVGATTGGSPGSGTFLLGDFVVDQTGSFWVCTTAGSPGTWTQVISGGGGGGGGWVGTTLGDTVYGAAGGTETRLAGNTTTTRKFLRQTGTGTVSAAPAWDTLQAADLPAATTSAQGAVVLDGTATDIHALGTQAAGSTGKAADAGHVHPATGVQTAVIDTTTGDIQASPGTAAAGSSGELADAKHVHPQPPVFAPTGLTGATSAGRFVGATASGHPSTGTFAVGDFSVDQTGSFWVCTSAGSPGSWTQVSGGSGFSNPMTTLGDLIYGGASGTATRLAGSTSATKQFLTQTGTGSVSAAPAWAGISAGDVPTLNQSTTGSAASFTGSLVGDVTGTQGATSVGKIQGVAVTSAEANLVSDLNNATARTATATLLPGEETIFSGSTGSQTLTLPASPASSINSVTNAATVSVTLAPGAGATLSNFGTSGNITIPVGYTFTVVYIGTTWYVVSAGPSDFAKNNALAIANGGTGATTAAAALTALGAAALAGATMTGWLAPAVATLTFGSSIAVNAALGNVFKLTLTASTGTIANPTNPVDGQVIRIRITQDATGSRTVAWGTAYDWGSTSGSANTAPTLTTAANDTDILGFEYNAATSKWMYLSAPFPQGF